MSQNSKNAMRDALLAESAAWWRTATRIHAFGRPPRYAFGYAVWISPPVSYAMTRRHLDHGAYPETDEDAITAALLFAAMAADEARALLPKKLRPKKRSSKGSSGGK